VLNVDDEANVVDGGRHWHDGSRAAPDRCPNRFCRSGAADCAQAFADAGVRHMQLNLLDFPRLDSLELFLAEVLPHFTRIGH